MQITLGRHTGSNTNQILTCRKLLLVLEIAEKGSYVALKGFYFSLRDEREDRSAAVRAFIQVPFDAGDLCRSYWCGTSIGAVRT
jgi:hypothetical protein